MSEIEDEAFDYVVSEYGSNGYQFWKALIGKEPLWARHPGRGCKEIEITVDWDSAPGGLIRVFLFCADGRSLVDQFLQQQGRSFLVDTDGAIR